MKLVEYEPNNASNSAELDIGVGDEVLVSRRNDVIPYVEEVVNKKGKTAKPPTKCAVCSQKLVNTGEYLSCKNQKCPAVVEGRIQNWVDAQGILEWGEKLIHQLVEAELVKEPALAVDEAIIGHQHPGELSGVFGVHPVE